jgi:hypothetical protein
MRPNELVQLACQAAGRSLTPLESAQYLAGQPYRAACP